MNEIREADVRKIVEQIIGSGNRNDEACRDENRKKENWISVPAEISARHVHLTKQDVEALFGAGAVLHPKRDLSQPGQYLCEERVRLIGAKNTMENIAVLGPVRSSTQVEVSLTDARALGVQAPIRQSGDLNGAGDVYIAGPKGLIHAKGAVIAAKAHVHMTPENAKQYGVTDGQTVKLRLETDRPITLENIIVRVSDQFALAAHIDFDEANAAHFTGKENAAICAGNCTLPAAAPAPEATFPSYRDTKGKKRLITEADALKMVAFGMKMPEENDVIVTPLAKDVFLHAKTK